MQELTEASFAGVDIGLFSAGSGTTKKFAAAAVKAGTVIVDNSSAFRMDAGVPLVVPEINREAIFTHKGIIANPNCSAIISITPLWPVHRKNRIKRMIISTYQAASGAGAAAMEELRESTRAYLDGRKFEHKVLPHPYAFNAFSHNTKIDPATGHNEEETKVINETRKIFGDPDIAIGITCVRIPVLARALRVGHVRVREADLARGSARDHRQGAGLPRSSTIRSATTSRCRSMRPARTRSSSAASAAT